MKTLKIMLFAVCLIITAEGCAQKNAFPKGVTAAQVDSLSYSLGVMMGMNFQQSKLAYLDMSVYTQAIGDVLAEKDQKIDMMAAQMFLQDYFMKMQELEQEGMESVAGSAAQIDSLSYSLGVMMGVQFQQSKLNYLNMPTYVQAIEDVLAEKELRFDMMAAQMFLQTYFTKIQEIEREEMEKVAAKNLEEGQKFLAKNKKEKGVIETPSGLQYKIITEGNGPKPAETDMVEAHYIGTLIDGTKFDSSYDRGETMTFPLNGVIKGWTEGLQLIPEGSKVFFYIPSELAYGSQSRGLQLPGNSTLIFEIELIKVIKAEETE
ncbi:MAG: FKBP-type peptidyl-prolyl cis-trans isomerase [Prevotellaceae bacterium]|nr:FKBP-type peptidyl-prolyl cis-trans isomerase [Prevotellaceae bacterium]